MRTVALPLLLLMMFAAGCGNEVVVYERLRLEITSEAPTSGTLSRYDIAIMAFDAEGKRVQKYPQPTSNELAKYAGPLPTGIDLVNKALLVDIDLSAYATGLPQNLQLRVRGLNDDLKAMTTWSGPIGASIKDKFTIALKRINSQCDQDGDGTMNCDQPGCCAAGEANDCDDSVEKGGSSSPFETENPCTQCGNGIDEDCDGADTPCVDSDSDSVPDCQETSCGAGAEQDDKVFPGAAELCDSKDNDCDGETDEDLAYLGLDGKPGQLSKGDSCGKGACAGGQVVCDPQGQSLICSTAKNKAEKEDCDNQVDDDCNGKINDGCALQDIDGDGVANDKEDLACAFKFARFHSEYHPGNSEPEQCCLAYTKLILEVDAGWNEKNEIPASAKVNQAILSACDTNCDKQVAPCGVKDKDGDGVSAPLDCNDNDPLIYPGAAEKCGDGVVQGCVGTDPNCDDEKDKDGDGWYAPADCDDNDPNTAPDAKEICNGIDNNCDGHVDSGNPEALDAVCGDKDGECGKQTGVKVCKHWPTGQDPSALDCLDKAFDADSLTCVGCVGDTRPEKDICDYLDNDCDGKSDEDYQYAEQSSGKKLLIGASCDGVGECGAGKVECQMAKDKAVCSTDPEGSKKQNKAEVCDNKDNNCDGKIDENLTTIADSTCSKTGVCAKSNIQSIKTVCKTGKWVCDYSNVPSIEFSKSKSCSPGDPFCHCPGLSTTGCFRLVESSCDGKDNDCDGKVDDDFVFDDLGKVKPVGVSCGTGVCASGKVVCTSNKSGLTCSTLSKVSKEICDGKDNNCNGKTDDGLTVLDSPCKLKGQCNSKNVVSSCPAGKWICDYSKVSAYEGSKEKSCDGQDNDCDGKADEDFSYSDLGKARTIGQGCGTGVCASGKV
ncbi:MAG TPA: hypothetical protein DCQ06_04335, partial [Myxococcales bacterium]|nr:hypothetical protein [Myxococcales bacterium]